jgi:hypothetical protein
MRLSQTQVMHRILVECLDAQWATKRDHPRARFDVAHSPAFIDGLAADDAKVIPICYIGIFKFTHKFISC